MRQRPRDGTAMPANDRTRLRSAIAPLTPSLRHRAARVGGRLGLLAAALLAAPVFAAAAHGMPRNGDAQARPGASLLFSPYKDAALAMQPGTGLMQTRVTGTTLPLVGPGSLVAKDLPKLRAITLAFATGSCGSERWGKLSGARFAHTNIPALDAAGVDYIISTGGGNGGRFTCANPQAFVKFVQRYLSPHMLGVDFDIESGQTEAEVKALVADAAAASRRYPRLRFSFTLATFAGTDGSYNGLNPLGATVVKAIQASALRHYVINLMVMDYDKANAHECVVANDACAMGRSALRAVANLQHTYHIPASKIALTPMIGNNDTPGQYFTPANLDTVMRFAASHHLAGVHFWSLDRDTPCTRTDLRLHPITKDAAPSICNTEPGATTLAYTRRALRDLGH